jgi:peptidoglycan/LPS O-acetylase OafA/YrhL
VTAWAGIALLSEPVLSALAALPIAYGAVALGCTRPRTIAVIRSGDYSYGLYVFAFPIQQVVASGPGAGHPWLSLLVTVPVTALLAFLSWHLIEAPALSLKKRHRPRVETAEL